MTLFYKRLLIMFSVALNIGFVVIATIVYVHHSSPLCYRRGFTDPLKMVHELEVPKDVEQDVVSEINGFRNALDIYSSELKEKRDAVIRYLAEPGEIDPAHLQTLIDEVEAREQMKRGLFKKHFLKIRDKLGPEKGALFFARLRAMKNK